MTPTEITQSTPREIDEQLAALSVQVYKVSDRLHLYADSALHEAGAEFYYQGKRRVTDMTLADAEAILAELLRTHDGDSDYTHVPGSRGRYNLGSVRNTVAGLAEKRAELADLRAQMDELEQLYTGWSRFFLVTSSKGHIHRSMTCSTCRPTTTYGWLPQLSGRTEADCVAEFGPALCSVCYPSAPVEWTIAELTKAQAAKASA